MIQLTFELRFFSDWHISTAYGDDNADSLIERDHNNAPYVRGATIKGLFQEAYLDFQDFKSLERLNPLENIRPVLGAPGIEGNWVFSNAHMLTAEGMHNADRTRVVTGVRVDPYLRRAEEGKLYRREMGERDSVFTFTITGNGTQPDVEWLIVMARYIRRLGNRRRRGAGACDVRLVEPEGLEAALLDSFEARLANETVPTVTLPQMHSDFSPDPTTNTTRFRVMLETLSPVVIAGTPEAGNTYAGQLVIPGRTLRGALGALATDYDSKAFVDAFYGGMASFSDLLPLTDAGKIVDELPAGLMRDKASSEIYSTLTMDKHIPTAKKFRGLQTLSDTSPAPDALKSLLELQTAMHVRIDNATKRASGGDLYAYEAIPAGRHYIGEITVDNWAQLSALLQLKIDTPKEIFIGKGRKRGYGRCRITVTPLPEDDSTPWRWSTLADRLALSNKSGIYTLTLASDTIRLDTWMRAIQRFEVGWLSDALGLAAEDITIIKQQVETTRVDGFDVRSGLPTWRDLALKRGATVAFTLKNGVTLDVRRLHALEINGLGLRCNEGFGRVVVNHPQHFRALSLYGDPLPIAIEQREGDTFGTWWANILHDKVSKGLKDDIYRVLARLLIEKQPRNPNDVKAIFAQLETLDASSYSLPSVYVQRRLDAKKELRLRRMVLDAVETALQILHDQQPAYWRRGVLALAQHINDAVTRPDEKETTP